MLKLDVRSTQCREFSTSWKLKKSEIHIKGTKRRKEHSRALGIGKATIASVYNFLKDWHYVSEKLICMDSGLFPQSSSQSPNSESTESLNNSLIRHFLQMNFILKDDGRPRTASMHTLMPGRWRNKHSHIPLFSCYRKHWVSAIFLADNHNVYLDHKTKNWVLGITFAEKNMEERNFSLWMFAIWWWVIVIMLHFSSLNMASSGSF